MPGRASRSRSSTGSRPPRRPSVVAARIESHTGPGDVVADLFGRGGWVARAAVDRQRLAVSLESTPAHPDARRGRPAAARRPPPRRRVPGDGRLAARHIEPQGLDRRPVRDALRDLQPDPRRRRDRLVGRRRGGDRRPGPAGHPPLPLHGLPRPARRARSCARRRSTPTTCAGPRADVGAEAMRATLLATLPDRARGGGPARRAARPPHGPPARRSRRHPRADRGRPARRAGPRRAAARAPPRDPAVQPAGDPTGPNRRAARLVRARPAAEPASRSANATRGWPSRTRSGSSAASSSGSSGGRPARSRHGSARTCAASARARRRRSSPSAARAAWSRCATIRTPTAGPLRRRASGSSSASRRCARASTGWAIAYHGTSWVLGREAASLLPLDALAGGSLRVPWSWQTTALAGALEAVEPSMARDGRVVQIVDGRAGGDRRDRARWGDRRLPARQRSAVRRRRRCGRDRRADPAGRSPAARRPDARQRRPRSAAGWGRGPGHRPLDAACSAPRSGSTSGRSRRRMRPGR